MRSGVLPISAIVDLSHEEVRDVSTTDNAEPPILWLG